MKQKSNGHPYTLRSFEIDENNPPDDGTALYIDDGGSDAAIGIVNCSSWSWGLNKMIGNASIRSKYAEIEDAWVRANGKCLKVKLSRGPLLKLERRKQVPAPIDV